MKNSINKEAEENIEPKVPYVLLPVPGKAASADKQLRLPRYAFIPGRLPGANEYINACRADKPQGQ